jgi:hypothetical protein
MATSSCLFALMLLARSDPAAMTPARALAMFVSTVDSSFT